MSVQCLFYFSCYADVEAALYRHSWDEGQPIHIRNARIQRRSWTALSFKNHMASIVGGRTSIEGGRSYRSFNLKATLCLAIGLFSDYAKRAEAHFWAETPEIFPQF